MKKLLIVSALALPFFANAQMQERSEPSASEIFSHMDSNGDNYVTESEMETAMSNRPQRGGGQGGQGRSPFDQFDSNGDGKLSLEEFEEMHNNRPQRGGIRN